MYCTIHKTIALVSILLYSYHNYTCTYLFSQAWYQWMVRTVPGGGGGAFFPRIQHTIQVIFSFDVHCYYTYIYIVHDGGLHADSNTIIYAYLISAPRRLDFRPRINLILWNEDNKVKMIQLDRQSRSGVIIMSSFVQLMPLVVVIILTARQCRATL